MAVYTENKGTITLLKKGQTLEEVVKKIKDKQGGSASSCVKDILNSKPAPKGGK